MVQNLILLVSSNIFCKHSNCRTIQSLWDYLEKTGINTKQLWESLKDLVIKTIISGESGITQLLRGNVNSRYNCYELFGVDVLLDENLKPWLLEVNNSNYEIKRLIIRFMVFRLIYLHHYIQRHR